MKLLPLALIAFGLWSSALVAAELERLRYQDRSLVVDLGVGLWAWPLPMDYDGDGDLDLVVSSGGKPYEGTYFFENRSGGAEKMPTFEPGKRVADYRTNVQISTDGTVMTPGRWYPEFLKSGFEQPIEVGLATDQIHRSGGRIRADQWKRVDYDGDGLEDLIVGLGDWGDYGWDDAWNERGEWRNGPLHGYVYWVRNLGFNQTPPWAAAQPIEASGKPIDVYGMPSPNLEDFDGDGDLDLICGEFLDGLTYFENTGTRRDPRYAYGKRLRDRQGSEIRMDLQMITPTAIDWTGDGRIDLIVGDEDGRVALVENTGSMVDGVPVFLPPRYFRQRAEFVKFGALATPVAVDWDADGDEDLISGNTAGYLAFIENLDGGNPPRLAPPKRLTADDEVIRIMAGENGSIQGPAEAKWGYSAPGVADWDGDGLLDVIANSIWGRVVWFRNVGETGAPRLARAQPIHVLEPVEHPEWNWWKPSAGELVTQWRTTPAVLDWDGDGATDLLMLDAAGRFALYRGNGKGAVDGPLTMFRSDTGAAYDSKHRVVGDVGVGALQLNTGRAGKSGRRKLTVVDWDGDGRLDLLVNSASAHWLRNIGPTEGNVVFEDKGPVTEQELAGHTTSPTTVDWDGDGVRDLLIGAEDGFFYYLKNPRSQRRAGRSR